MSSHSRTARHLSGHQWAGILLALAAVVVLAAERLAAAPRWMNAPVAGTDAFGDVGAFLSPVSADLGQRRADIVVSSDPFAVKQQGDAFVVAPAAAVPTVNTSRRPARQLTAILIADDRPVAVIDGEVVNVGDYLPDGAKVASIREDRVSLLERGGRRQVLTMATGRRQ